MYTAVIKAVYSRGFPSCGIGPSIQVTVIDYVTADDLYSVS
jgi:hypothetical protein